VNLELATAVRTAIDNTLSALRPPVMGAHLPDATRTALQTHLDALLKAELQALTGQAREGDLYGKFVQQFAAYIDPRKDPVPDADRATGRVNLAEVVKDTPWYPDDSGEWVEVPDDCTVCPLPTTSIIEILWLEERAAKKWRPSPAIARGFHWNEPPDSDQRIVAYKVVKP
jgi:hypothetical protein